MTSRVIKLTCIALLILAIAAVGLVVWLRYAQARAYGRLSVTVDRIIDVADDFGERSAGGLCAEFVTLAQANDPPSSECRRVVVVSEVAPDDPSPPDLDVLLERFPTPLAFALMPARQREVWMAKRIQAMLLVAPGSATVFRRDGRVLALANPTDDDGPQRWGMDVHSATTRAMLYWSDQDGAPADPQHVLLAFLRERGEEQR